jgi:predicted kinase
MTAANPLPSLIVVAGRPGAGKTTLAHALAKTIRCPAICRDEIKEGFVNTTGQIGTPGDAIAWHLYDAFFDTVELLLGRQITLVAEAAFGHALWAKKAQRLGELARIRVIVCDLAPELARARHIERGLADPLRERFHYDRAVKASRDAESPPIGGYEPPHLDVPTLTVDTSDGYRPVFEEIVAFARAREGEK